MRWTYLTGLFIMVCSQAQAYNFPAQDIRPYSCSPACSALSHEALQSSWALSDHPLRHPAPLRQLSYSYQQKVSAAELQSGVRINTLAPGAVLRISPIAGSTLPPLQIQTKGNKLLNLKEASTLISQNEGFGEPGFGSESQTILQFKRELGAGPFKLLSKGTQLHKNDAFIISVYDKYSNVYLSIETDKQEYKTNDILRATVTLNADLDYPIESIKTWITNPRGTQLPLIIDKVGSNKYEAMTVITSTENNFGENWYIDVELKVYIGDDMVTRRGHVGFSYAIPSASLIDIKKSSNDPYTLKAGVEVAHPSRYTLQSVLYTKDKEGKLHPLSTNQTANWLEKGQNTLEFTLDKNVLNQYDSSSLYIGYFHLLDYGQLKTVYHYDKPVKLSELG